MSSTASSLRWRARTTKEAYTNDDSSTVHVEGKDDRSRLGYRLKPWTIGLWIAAPTAILCSIYSLQVVHTWFMAVTCTLTVSISGLTLWQRRQLAKLGTLRAVHNETRSRVQQMRQQNERLYRHLSRLDQSFDRVHQVRSEFQRLAGNTDPERLIRILERYRLVNNRLEVKLQQQVQGQILRAVLRTDRDADFHLSHQEAERLILQLKMIQGVQFDEGHLREILFDEEELSLATIVRLLKQVVRDSQTHSSTAVFHFDPQHLRKSNQKVHEC